MSFKLADLVNIALEEGSYFRSKEWCEQQNGKLLVEHNQEDWQKSFFDAVNESLMKFRPYGLTGEPMPWSNKVRRLQTKVEISSVDTERLFQMVK